MARIEVVGSLTSVQRRDRLEAVHDAVVAALQVPGDDPTVTITEIDPDNIVMPGGVSESYTVVQITMFAGRSTETKRALYRGLCDSLTALGIPRSDIVVVIIESPTQNWGVEGGLPASEVDLGFRVDI